MGTSELLGQPGRMLGGNTYNGLAADPGEAMTYNGLAAHPGEAMTYKGLAAHPGRGGNTPNHSLHFATGTGVKHQQLLACWTY